MLRAFDNLDRAYKGYDTSLALLAVIRSLSYSPGPKTIVLFSEGLPVSPVLSTRFDALIEERSTYSAQAAIVVRFRDRKGQEVQAVGQQYVLSGEAKDLEAAKRGEILFYREADFAPGVYTMETIVMDVVAHQGSARVATLNVSAPGTSGFDMSSLVLVSRAEEVTAGQAVPDAPLYVGHTLLYPNLGEPIKKSAAAEMPFYFTMYGNLSR